MMSTFHVYAADDEARSRVRLRKIGTSDVYDALRLGYEDFSAKPSHYVFLCIIYPIIGFILVFWASGGNTFQLVYPLLTGFALLGPIAAVPLYEISRERESGEDADWSHARGVLLSPAMPSIAAAGVMLLALFLVWMFTAQGLYTALFGTDPPASIGEFLWAVLTTGNGWLLIILGNAFGFLFALIVLSTTVITFPLLLDRDIGAIAAVRTSVNAMLYNPVPMLLWGVIVAASMLVGSLPVLAGLIVILPVLGHSTWHLYRKVVEPLPAEKGAA